MPEINVDGLLFVFPEGWEVDKFDEWAFYRNQFSKQHNNIKAVDLLALECSKKTLWLIEVKDFSCHKRDKTEDLSDEIFGKIISTLAALLPAKVNASKIEERNFEKKAIRASKIRVVFQVYQPRKPSKLFPKSFDESDLQKEFNISFKGEFSFQVQDLRRSCGVLQRSIPVPFSTRGLSSAGCLSGTLPSSISHAD